MNVEILELAKRAVACKNWKWMAGMRYSTDHWPEGFDRVIDLPERAAFADWLVKDRYPDLSDPATVGCLFDLVRKAWHTAPANVYNHTTSYTSTEDHFCFWTCSYHTAKRWEQTRGKTEAEALVLALEASNA